MKLKQLRISNFQSFGEQPTTITFERTTSLISPNGSGKTAALQALYRMFGIDAGIRRGQRTHFRVNPEQAQETLQTKASCGSASGLPNSGLRQSACSAIRNCFGFCRDSEKDFRRLIQIFCSAQCRLKLAIRSVTGVRIRPFNT